MDQSAIGKVLTKAKKEGTIVQIPTKELKTVIEQTVYAHPSERKIYNTIRDVTEADKISGQKTKKGKTVKSS